MTTNDESEIAGRLGASLTPRVPRITVQHRGEQSSGLFDIGAMYAASVEQVMRRARAVRQPPRVFELAEGARASQGSPLHAWATPRLQRAIDIDLEDPAPIVRAHGVGWFGVAVAWLATTAIGVTIATTVPAHTVQRGAPVLAVAATAPVVTPAASPPAPAAVLTTVAGTQPVALTPEPAPPAVPKKLGVTPHPRTMTLVHPVQAEPAASPVQPQKVPPSTASLPSKAAPPAAPPATGGSLEDLMRRAVEADSKHH